MQSARESLESAPDDWFDAQSLSGAGPEQGLITVVEQESDTENRHDESTDEEDELNALRAGAISPLLTMAPAPRSAKKELYPLGEWRGRQVKRRITLPTQITIPPPSLLAFLRKNVHPLKQMLILGWQGLFHHCNASDIQRTHNSSPTSPRRSRIHSSPRPRKHNSHPIAKNALPSSLRTILPFLPPLP
jgi:hypothetical protein